MLAVNDINDSDDILPGTTLVPIVYDGESTVSVSDLLFKDNPDVLTSPPRVLFPPL